MWHTAPTLPHLCERLPLSDFAVRLPQHEASLLELEFGQPRPVLLGGATYSLTCFSAPRSSSFSVSVRSRSMAGIRCLGGLSVDVGVGIQLCLL
jgi:hypothetical protein